MANTGVFHVPGKTGGGAYRKRKPAVQGLPRITEHVHTLQAARDVRRDEFAEALAEGFTIAEAAEMVGVCVDVGKRYFRSICAGIEARGWFRCE